MEDLAPTPESLVRPWRTATLVASGVAAVELVLLLAAGLVLIGKPLSHHARAAAEKKALTPAKAAPPRAPRPEPLGAPRLARRDTAVLVLNGNGRPGAAGAEAAIVRARGYVVSGVGNSRRTHGRTVVMYRPGYRAEAARLARDLRVKIFAPLDGLRPADLLGAQLAVVVGS